MKDQSLLIYFVRDTVSFGYEVSFPVRSVLFVYLHHLVRVEREIRSELQQKYGRRLTRDKRDLPRCRFGGGKTVEIIDTREVVISQIDPSLLRMADKPQYETVYLIEVNPFALEVCYTFKDRSFRDIDDFW